MLELAAAAWQRGAKYRFKVLTDALALIKRVKSLSPELSKQEILAVIARPRTLERILDTLHLQDAEGYRKSVYQAAGLQEEDGLFLVSTDSTGSVPTFDTRTGKEVSVPAESIIPGPVDHPPYILQWIRLGSSEVWYFTIAVLRSI